MTLELIPTGSSHGKWGPRGAAPEQRVDPAGVGARASVPTVQEMPGPVQVPCVTSNSSMSRHVHSAQPRAGGWPGCRGCEASRPRPHLESPDLASPVLQKGPLRGQKGKACCDLLSETCVWQAFAYFLKNIFLAPLKNKMKGNQTRVANKKVYEEIALLLNQTPAPLDSPPENSKPA